MSISISNSASVSPQSFKGDDLDVAEKAQKIINLSKEVDDSFVKKEVDGKQIKSPIATAMSVLIPVLSIFVLGKGIAKKGTNLAKGLSPETKGKISQHAGKAFETVKKGIGKIKNEKVSGFINNSLDNITKFVKKDPEKLVENLAGAIATATVVPHIVTADGNGDNVADIAQKDVNAYKSAVQNLEILSEIGTLLM